MEKDFIEKCKQALEAQRDEIIAEQIAREKERLELVGQSDHGDDADIADKAVTGNLLDKISQGSELKMTMIERALERIMRGTYGKCLSCGTEIATKRLEVIPYAALCVSCQSKKDKMR